MTHLTPSIGRSVESIMKKAGIDFTWLDPEGGLCCGRPMFTAGRIAEAKAIVANMEKLILDSGCDTLLVSCPICYKMFREKYNLPGVEVVNYIPFINDLINSGRIKVEKSDICYVYHDPCELGRGSGIYEEPRKLLRTSCYLVEAAKNREESVCCSGSLGSLTLGFADRKELTEAALHNLTSDIPDAIATACPLCRSTFRRYSDIPVSDIAEVIDSRT
jgi:Fe-S oxidoreductase